MRNSLQTKVSLSEEKTLWGKKKKKLIGNFMPCQDTFSRFFWRTSYSAMPLMPLKQVLGRGAGHGEAP